MDRAYEQGIEIGIRNTIAALYEANIEDNDIINLLTNIGE